MNDPARERWGSLASRRRGSAIVMLVVAGAAQGLGTPALAAVDDYELLYVEDLPSLSGPTDPTGIAPGALVPAYSDDGEWIYYHALCFKFEPLGQDPWVTPGCPVDGSGEPDGRNHVRRVRIDGTDDECLTCGTSASGANWGWHSGSPEVHGDWMIFSREREDHDPLPPGSCGGGNTAPGGGPYHDLWVLNLDTGVETLLWESVTYFVLPGLLDPRFSADGSRILWSEFQSPPLSDPPDPNMRSGNWRMRIATFVPGDLFNANPHLHSLGGGHFTAPTAIDPGEDGVRITGGFLNADGTEGAYFAGPILDGQDMFHGDFATVQFPGLELDRLTETSGLSSEDAEYEEHIHLNQKYWDAYLYMTSEPYGPPTDEECFLNDLYTDLWLMNGDGSDKTQVTFYNDPEASWVGEDLNPNEYQTVVSKLQWAPNGIDAVASHVFFTGIPEAAAESHLAIYHFARLQNPGSDAATSGDGFETGTANLYQDGSGYASNINGTAQLHEFGDFEISMSQTIDLSDVVIDDIEVRLDWWSDSTTNGPYIGVQLSWDGGTSWSQWDQTPVGATSERTDVLNGASATWGRTWDAAAGELSDGNLKVRLSTYCQQVGQCLINGRDFFLDWVAVKVTWHVAP